MSDIDPKKLAEDMLAAAKPSLLAHWNSVRPFAATEMAKLAETAVQIKLGQEDKSQGDNSLTPEQARILLKMQANASQAVLTAVETVGMIAAQDAINAALNVLKQAVNTAIGFAFL
jgi:hypothetical protein